jgi:tRNA-dihydrouridine synthase 3
VNLRDVLTGAVVMGPMTKGSNLPYRRLCAGLGAKVLVSEMVLARRLKQRRRGEFALIRRAPEESVFAVQLAGNAPDEMAWAAALVESRGADFVDINCGCPIDFFTRKGLGAALSRQPNKIRKIVAAMTSAVQIPVTVKIRLGWKDDDRNALEQARAAADGGASALFVHGRTREARYRLPAEWDAIAAIASAVSIPVIGNGDLLYPQEISERQAASGCAGVMVARGALIKPWIFREATDGYWDITAEERVAIYREYVRLSSEHWRRPDQTELDDYARQRLREFLRWHVGFWCRYAPQRPDGSWPSMQTREGSIAARSPLEALLARDDDAALDYVTDQLIAGGDFAEPPAKSETAPVDPRRRDARDARDSEASAQQDLVAG